MPHPRMHVCLGALDMIVQVIPEELDMGDSTRCDRTVREVAGEEDESNVANILAVTQAWEVTDFKWRIAT
jgi:hypothetical protein